MIIQFTGHCYLIYELVCDLVVNRDSEVAADYSIV